MSPSQPAADLTHDGCGCERADPPGRGPSRRSVLAALGLGGAAVAASSTLSSRIAFAATPGPTDTLVVLSMRGGWDGLSIVAPVGDPDYARIRPNIGLPASLALPAGGVFGLHPALAPLKPMWTAGTFGAVHAVGQPSGMRSHFKDSEELERAAPGSSLRTGWLDRVLVARGTGTAFQAVQLGSEMVPYSLAGPAPTLAMNAVDDFQLSVWDGVRPQFRTALAALHAGVTHPVTLQASTTLAAIDTTTAMKAAGYTPAGVTYPTSDLGKGLRDLARLIKANVGLQVACLDYGDWDMHHDIGAPGDTRGWMHRQLADVAASLAAFATDLGTAMGRVSVVTLSEFGRRAAENGSGGADHGYGQAVLLLGGGIVGGKVHGRWPTLAATALDQGDVAGTTDYRSVLGELLQKRCGIGALDAVFPGFTPAPLGLATQAA